MAKTSAAWLRSRAQHRFATAAQRSRMLLARAMRSSVFSLTLPSLSTICWRGAGGLRGRVRLMCARL